MALDDLDLFIYPDKELMIKDNSFYYPISKDCFYIVRLGKEPDTGRKYISAGFFNSGLELNNSIYYLDGTRLSDGNPSYEDHFHDAWASTRIEGTDVGCGFLYDKELNLLYIGEKRSELWKMIGNMVDLRRSMGDMHY